MTYSERSVRPIFPWTGFRQTRLVPQRATEAQHGFDHNEPRFTTKCIAIEEPRTHTMHRAQRLHYLNCWICLCAWFTSCTSIFQVFSTLSSRFYPLPPARSPRGPSVVCITFQVRGNHHSPIREGLGRNAPTLTYPVTSVLGSGNVCLAV